MPIPKNKIRWPSNTWTHSPHYLSSSWVSFDAIGLCAYAGSRKPEFKQQLGIASHRIASHLIPSSTICRRKSFHSKSSPTDTCISPLMVCPWARAKGWPAGGVTSQRHCQIAEILPFRAQYDMPDGQMLRDRSFRGPSVSLHDAWRMTHKVSSKGTCYVLAPWAEMFGVEGGSCGSCGMRLQTTLGAKSGVPDTQNCPLDSSAVSGAPESTRGSWCRVNLDANPDGRSEAHQQRPKSPRGRGIKPRTARHSCHAHPVLKGLPSDLRPGELKSLVIDGFVGMLCFDHFYLSLGYMMPLSNDVLFLSLRQMFQEMQISQHLAIYDNRQELPSASDLACRVAPDFPSRHMYEPCEASHPSAPSA